VVSAPFEIGCPPDTSLQTFTINDVAIVAEIKDWYCTNKMDLDLPFAVPNWFDHDALDEAALEVTFSLPMAMEKYDPHTVIISINGEEIARLENNIPQGLYTFRFPTSLINLGKDAPAENRLQLHVEGITKGQYIVATDFKVILNLDEIHVDLCVPPPQDWLPGKISLPPGQTIIKPVTPTTKFRPGETVQITVKLHNNDSHKNSSHRGFLTLIVKNEDNKDKNRVEPNEFYREVAIEGGKTETLTFQCKIPKTADDVEYTYEVTFQNSTLGTTSHLSDQEGFYVRRPLVIVHGIMGSSLYETLGNEDPKEVFTPLKALLPCDSFVDDLLCEDMYSDEPVSCDIRAKNVLKEKVKFSFFGLSEVTFGDVFRGLESYLHSQRYDIYKPGSDENIWFDANNVRLSKDSEDIFYFVYDWRQDCFNSADELKTFVSSVLDATGCDKINLLAHSLGGLVAKAMFAENPEVKDRVNKLMLIGVPNLGVVEAFSMMKHGLQAPRWGSLILIDETELATNVISNISMLKSALDTITDPTLFNYISSLISAVEQDIKVISPEFCNNKLEIAKLLLNIISLMKGDPLGIIGQFYDYYNLDKDLNFIRDSQAKKLMPTMPSAYQLLPSQKYFDFFVDGYYVRDGTPINFQSSPSIDDEIVEMQPEGTQLYADAIALHSMIDDFHGLPNNSYLVVGCKKRTATVLHESSEPLALYFQPGDGDKRVPLESALYADVKLKYVAPYAEHSNLPSHPGVVRLIRALLKGEEEDFEISTKNPVAEFEQNVCGLPSGALITVNPSSGSLGIRGTSGQNSSDGSVGIWPRIYLPGSKRGPNRFDPEGFTGYTGNKIHIGIFGSDFTPTSQGVEVFVPEGSVYSLEFHGLDDQFLDLKVQMMEEGGVNRTLVFADVPIDLNGCGEIRLDLTNLMTNPVMRLDYECDGQFDQEGIAPDYELDEAKSADIIPPVTTASLSGNLVKDGIYTSNVTLTLTATEETDGSGVLVTRYRLGGETSFTDYSDPIDFTELGDYTVYFYSMDRNLNKEAVQEIHFTIDNGPPTIVSVTPSNNADAVNRSSRIQVVFSESMDKNTLTSDNIIVSGSVTGTHSGSITYDENTNTLTFIPDTKFLLEEAVSVFVSANVTDLEGLPLDGNKNGQCEGPGVDDSSWSFNISDNDGFTVRITDIDMSRCPTVRATVIVTDENGEVVSNLNSSEFYVYEDNMSQGPIRSAFLDQSAFPVSVSLALDYSGSMSSSAISDMEDAAITFINNMTEDDEGEIIKFAHGVEVTEAFTPDKNLLIDAVNSNAGIPNYSTSLYDAMIQAISDTSLRSGRKAVIAMTDGKDNNSSHTEADVINEAVSSGVLVFTVGLGDSIDATVLENIAAQTGGVYYEAPTSQDLQAIYEAISSVLKNQYILIYKADKRDAQDHTLQIVADNGVLAGSNTVSFTTCLDTDRDELWDDWEQQVVDSNEQDNIININGVLPWEDFDEDGFSNMREFLAGSDPTDPGSIPPCWADMSSDGDVDGEDLAIFATDFQPLDCLGAPPCRCDLDLDELVNEMDLHFLSEDYGRVDCR